MRALEKMVADDGLQFIVGHIQHCLVAPLVIAFFVQRIDRFAGAFHNIFQERLPLARHGFDLAQL